jgi:hypothetical protein
VESLGALFLLHNGHLLHGDQFFFSILLALGVLVPVRSSLLCSFFVDMVVVCIRLHLIDEINILEISMSDLQIKRALVPTIRGVVGIHSAMYWEGVQMGIALGNEIFRCTSIDWRRTVIADMNNHAR